MGVDPATVPSRTLANGDTIPAIGLGTFGSDRYRAEEIAAAVRDAITLGYQHIDCAAVYNNEPQIGEALHAAMKAGISREGLWITSKLWNDRHRERDVVPACQQSLKDLKLEYLDLYLVHWPFPNSHAPGADPGSRDPHARPYIHDEYMTTWGQMERLVGLGLVRHIGTSNMTIPKLELVLRDATIWPACNEMELHPHFQQPELFDYVTRNGIVPIGYSPIGSPRRPGRDRTASDSADIDDPVIVKIAQAHNLHPAAVCIKWAIQRGQIPIPFSVHRDKYLANLEAAVSPPLSDAEMHAIKHIDRNCRLIKGQVFLWKDGQSWEDLWDPDGRITPP